MHAAAAVLAAAVAGGFPREATPKCTMQETVSLQCVEWYPFVCTISARYYLTFYCNPRHHLLVFLPEMGSWRLLACDASRYCTCRSFFFFLSANPFVDRHELSRLMLLLVGNDWTEGLACPGLALSLSCLVQVSRCTAASQPASQPKPATI